MLQILQDLIRHKGYVDAALLRAIRQNEKAARDEQLRKLLHHMILANRFWFMLAIGRPFALHEESRIPESLEAIAARYRETYDEELEWISALSEADLARRLESTLIPGNSCTLAEGLIQVCMHGHGHRSQCATQLRLCGGTPPALDFILWLENRPSADWS